ncbi:MAG: hypothetical protein ACOYX5_13940 [Actinomycetota bacterium]
MPVGSGPEGRAGYVAQATVPRDERLGGGRRENRLPARRTSVTLATWAGPTWAAIEQRGA